MLKLILQNRVYNYLTVFFMFNRALAVSINEMNQSTNRKKSSKVVDYISDPEQCLRKGAF